MSTFPDGNFTIVNDETGRCVRVRLGRTQDLSDWQAGTKYLQHVTAKPTLELGEPDGSPATAWWFSTIDDAVERHPFNQIVSHAVGEYQNIGNHCVWLDLQSHPTAEDRRRAADEFRRKLNDMPGNLKEKLAVLLPAAFLTEAETELGADASLPEVLDLWHGYCASLKFPQQNIEEEDLEGPEAAQSYLDAAAEEGIHPPAVKADRTSTRMYGCGASRGKNSTYRWAYDGTHIYGADSKTVPSERTYWTDDGGYLVGKNKGGPGQTWTLASWKPPAPQSDPVKAIALTGLFGPIANLLGS
ncbi:hypothetical protein [Streptomyces sp. NPDC085665]|uniref:hypothetical protein n=1 Tax=Streptomyces sp. NPDC085665 TaxID=3365735 RepID=UPI0037D41D4C